jgi:replicative DNA helicase
MLRLSLAIVFCMANLAVTSASMISATESEKVVIGSFLIEKDAISSCIDLIQPEHFYDQANSAICRTVYSLFKEGRPVDVVSVIEAGKKDLISFPGLSAYLLECLNSVTTASHASYHAKTILDAFYAKQIMIAAKKLAQEQDADNLRLVQELVLKRDSIHAPPVFTYANGLFDFIDQIGSKSSKQLYRTGYTSLDSYWHGVGEGEIITIGAATNVGKSLLCLNLLNNMAGRGIKCLYAGTEMSSLETTTRHISIASGVSAYKLRIGRIDMIDQGKIRDAISDRLYNMNVTMMDHPSPSLSDISSAILNSGAKVVFLDYLGRLNLVKAENYRLRIHETMIGLKTMARKHNIVIFLAAQLGRQVYAQGTPKPTLADLSESKSIEAESDKVLLAWVDPSKQIEGKTVLSFINAKNRQGKRGQEYDMTLDSNTLAIREITE